MTLLVLDTFQKGSKNVIQTLFLNVKFIMQNSDVQILLEPIFFNSKFIIFNKNNTRYRAELTFSNISSEVQPTRCQ